MSENKIYGQGKCCKCGKNISTSDVTKKKCNKCHVEEIKNHFNIPTEEEITRLTAEVERLKKELDKAVELIYRYAECPHVQAEIDGGQKCEDCMTKHPYDTATIKPTVIKCWRDYLTTGGEE